MKCVYYAVVARTYTRAHVSKGRESGLYYKDTHRKNPPSYRNRPKLGSLWALWDPLRWCCQSARHGVRQHLPTAAGTEEMQRSLPLVALLLKVLGGPGYLQLAS